MSETPEAQARDKIDRRFEACAWVVQNHGGAGISGSRGVAIREFPLQGGDEGDKLLNGDAKRGFDGKLVPHDPEDEPSTVLLERIREQAGRH